MVEGVFPAVMVQWTVLDRPHRVLPLVALVQRTALYDASTRKSEDAWMQVFQCLSQVAAHTVLAVLIGVDWEQ